MILFLQLIGGLIGTAADPKCLVGGFGDVVVVAVVFVVDLAVVSTASIVVSLGDADGDGDGDGDVGFDDALSCRNSYAIRRMLFWISVIELVEAAGNCRSESAEMPQPSTSERS